MCQLVSAIPIAAQEHLACVVSIGGFDAIPFSPRVSFCVFDADRDPGALQFDLCVGAIRLDDGAGDAAIAVRSLMVSAMLQSQ